MKKNGKTKASMKRKAVARRVQPDANVAKAAASSTEFIKDHPNVLVVEVPKVDGDAETSAVAPGDPERRSSPRIGWPGEGKPEDSER